MEARKSQSLTEAHDVKIPEEAGELVSQLFRSHGAQLLAYLERMLGRRALAEEVAQEAYLKLYRYCRPEEVACPEALLFNMATKLASARLRRIQAEATLMGAIATPAEIAAVEQVPDERAGLDRQAACEQSLLWLEQILGLLPERLREALTLHHVEQLSYREIGLRLGITTKAAEKRVLRALIHSRRWLSSRGLLWLGPE